MASPLVFSQTVSQDATARRIKTKVVPLYPALAKQMHLAGKVKLEVTVSPEGAVKDIKVVGGSPLLVRASEDAVKAWKYEAASRESTEVVEFNFSSAD